MSEPDIRACAVCKLGPPDWEYTCGDCGNGFTMPAAKGPSEEKRRTCPVCGSPNIAYHISKSEACAPGG